MPDREMFRGGPGHRGTVVGVDSGPVRQGHGLVEHLTTEICDIPVHLISHVGLTGDDQIPFTPHLGNDPNPRRRKPLHPKPNRFQSLQSPPKFVTLINLSHIRFSSPSDSALIGDSELCAEPTRPGSGG